MKSLVSSHSRPLVILAPMAGVTDQAYRALMTRYGADLTYTEMVSAAGLHYNNKRTWDMLDGMPDEARVGVQLFGHNPHTLSEQAHRIESVLQDRLAVIDINMACPVRKVLKNGDGSALLLKPELASALVAQVKDRVLCPVSVKMRIGYSAGDNLGERLALHLAQAGVDALAVHGRTASQLYRKTSSHEQVARIFKSLNEAGYQDIIKLVSGDIMSPESAVQALAITHAHAVLIARGSYGNPFIFSQTAELLSGAQTYTRYSLTDHLRAAEEHCELYIASGGHLPRLRKVLAWYFAGFPHASQLRAQCAGINSVHDVRAILTRAHEALTQS